MSSTLQKCVTLSMHRIASHRILQHFGIACTMYIFNRDNADISCQKSKISIGYWLHVLSVITIDEMPNELENHSILHGGAVGSWNVGCEFHFDVSNWTLAITFQDKGKRFNWIMIGFLTKLTQNTIISMLCVSTTSRGRPARINKIWPFLAKWRSQQHDSWDTVNDSNLDCLLPASFHFLSLCLA